jgi:hypothetical protein
VENSQRIDLFLMEKVNIPPFKIKILLKSRGVSIIPRLFKDTIFEGYKFEVIGEDTRVHDKDRVDVKNPFPDLYYSLLLGIPESDFFDYAFVPPSKGDLFLDDAATIFNCRPQTIQLSDPSITSLSEFLNSLTHNNKIIHPIRDLFISSHAHKFGHLMIKLYSKSDITDIIYEDLENAITSKDLFIKDDTLMPRPVDKKKGKMINSTLHLKGCNIGKSLPYLTALKDALGGKLFVTAPKHEYCTLDHPDPNPGKAIFMRYRFELFRKSRLKGRTEAVKAFNSYGFSGIDGRKILIGTWERWIPKYMSPIWIQKEDFRTTVINPITGNPMTARVRLLYTENESVSPREQRIPLAKKPTSDVESLSEIEKDLKKREPRYNHKKFPMYERYGCASMEEFMAGWNWKYSWDNNKKELVYKGIRYEHTLEYPIVDPSNNTLFMNLYPSKSGSTVLEMMKEDDDRFFGKA